VSGVPMVAVAQWPEQPMNAWYVEAAWCVDVRVRPAAPRRAERRPTCGTTERKIEDKLGETSHMFHGPWVCQRSSTSPLIEAKLSKYEMIFFLKKCDACKLTHDVPWS
jgi:hypothetical protein